MLELRFHASLKELNPDNSISSLSIHKAIDTGEKEHFRQKHRNTLATEVSESE